MKLRKTKLPLPAEKPYLMRPCEQGEGWGEGKIVSFIGVVPHVNPLSLTLSREGRGNKTASLRAKSIKLVPFKPDTDALDFGGLVDKDPRPIRHC